MWGRMTSRSSTISRMRSGPFLHVDVEVVLPEIDQHFLQLALGIDRAHQLGLLQLPIAATVRPWPPWPARLSTARLPAHSWGEPVGGVRGRHCAIRGCRHRGAGRRSARRPGIRGWPAGQAAFASSVAACPRRKKDRPAAGRSSAAGRTAPPPLRRRVVDGLRMQLLLDVMSQPHLLDRLHVARLGAKRDAVEDVDDLLAVTYVGRPFLRPPPATPPARGPLSSVPRLGMGFIVHPMTSACW